MSCLLFTVALVKAIRGDLISTFTAMEEASSKTGLKRDWEKTKYVYAANKQPLNPAFQNLEIGKKDLEAVKYRVSLENGVRVLKPVEICEI